jgi:DNA-binding response OmpR family regulator
LRKGTLAGDMRLLIVEDEVRIAELVRGGLTRAGFAVDTAGTAADAIAALEIGSYDAAVLDLGLPDGDGLDVLTQARRSGRTIPFLLLTARDTVDDRVLGLNAGADDYLIKPFAMDELVARTKALLRRPGLALGVLLEAGNIQFDTVGREVRVAGEALPLPRRELDVLEHLLRRAGRVVPKTVLEDKLYGQGEELESNAIPVHVSHLRRKLIAAGATPEIHTIRGVGYLLEEKSR